MTAITLDQVDLTYQSRAGAVPALAGLDLSIVPGSFVSILGPSGCGKSTIIKLVSGLLAPTAGTVLVNGQRVNGPQKGIGIVFQKPTLLPWKSVLNNILVAAYGRGADHGAARTRAAELVRMVQLAGFENHSPHELSGGMQQRVGLARALMHDPSVLLMDEPFAALDALTREEMSLELMRLWSQDEKTVIFVTHSIPEAVFLSDRVIVLSPRPARIVDDVEISLPRPRTLQTMESPGFNRLCTYLRQRLLAAGTPKTEAAA